MRNPREERSVDAESSPEGQPSGVREGGPGRTGQRAPWSSSERSERRSVIRGARSRPTEAHVMYCQVARRGDRWLWYFALANHKIRTQQEGSDFQERLLQSEHQSSGSHSRVAL